MPRASPRSSTCATAWSRWARTIDGIGTETLTIEGVDRLHGATYRVMADRIEAGSYACAAVITEGDVELVGAKADEMEATLSALRQAGATVEETKTGIRVAMSGRAEPVTLSTAPYPGFATDMQAQFMAMATLGKGASLFTETIFENRYMHVPELARMGCDIDVRGRSAVVRGVDHLVGAPVMATDLRASMSLIIAGLAARGHDRGQPRLSPRPRLRTAGRKAPGGRRRHRTDQRGLTLFVRCSARP